MSEEAVRQTRSQKRALEREAPLPLTAEPSSSAAEADCKKPKLDDGPPSSPSSPPDIPETKPTETQKQLAQDGQSRTRTGPEAEREQLPRPDQASLLPLPIPLPLPPLVLPIPQLKREPERHQRQQQQAEPGPDNRTERTNDRAARAVKSEPPGVDVRSRLRPSEPRVSGGLLSAGEVKATIKVEVQTGEQPMDMSSTTRGGVKREKRPPSPDDDVIILSDNDSSPSPPMNGLSHFKELDTDLLMRSSQEERERIIKQLKEELRLEEAKLVLLKKLRQSQIQKDTLQKPSGMSGSVAPPPLIRGTMTSNKGSQQQMQTGRSSGTVIPPPLVRGGQQTSSKHGSQIIMPPLVRGSQPISVSPQQIQALRQQQQQQLAASGDSGGPPPLLLAPRASAPGGQNQRGMVQSGLIRVGSVGNASLLVNITQASSGGLKASSGLTSQSAGGGGVSVVNVNDTPAARQAAAKLALRKQLEKTLLEIPPPKPPAPEFNFLPSAANNEFIYLVGLEEVVQNLLDNIHRGKTGVSMSKPAAREPYTCTQCHTDFTCRWRQDKAKGGTILCEDCMSSNQKKALKAEHTNRLKAAFVKALQQEQEIEQRILQQAASPVSHATSSSSSSQSSASPSMRVEQLVSAQLKQQAHQAQARSSSSMQHHHHQHSRGQGMVHHHSSNIKQGQLSRSSSVSSMGVRSGPHSFSSSSQLQSAVAAAALVNRPGKHQVAYVSRPPSSQSSKVSSSGGSGSGGVSGASSSAAAWRKQSGGAGNAGVTMAYVNPSLSGHKSSSSVDARQREYLLDMIPSRSISQTANTWK